MIQEKSCGAVIFAEKDGETLYLIEYMQKGHTSFCKGHVEGNETEHETATREIWEEAGLTVDFLPGFREETEYSPYPSCRKRVVLFLARAHSMEVTAQEAEVRALAWLPFEEALKVQTYEADRQVLRRAEVFLRAKGTGK